MRRKSEEDVEVKWEEFRQRLIRFYEEAKEETAGLTKGNQQWSRR